MTGCNKKAVPMHSHSLRSCVSANLLSVRAHYYFAAVIEVNSSALVRQQVAEPVFGGIVYPFFYKVCVKVPLQDYLPGLLTTLRQVSHAEKIVRRQSWIAVLFARHFRKVISAEA